MIRCLTMMLLLLTPLFAACEEKEETPLNEPGTKLTDVNVEGPCDADNVSETGDFYYPTKGDLQGAWYGTDMWDVTMILDDGYVTRVDHVNTGCTSPTGCANDIVVTYGTYTVHNAFLLFTWDSSPPLTSLHLPDLMYTMIACDDEVVLFESSPVSGEVDFQKD